MMLRRKKQPPARSLAGILASEPRAHVVITPPLLPVTTQQLSGPGPEEPVPFAYNTAQPARPLPEVPSARTVEAAPRRYAIVVSGGERISVSGTGVVGRNPSRDSDAVHAITIPDPNKLLSRNHFSFGLTSTGQLWATDLHSANGTFHDDGQLAPGTRTALAPGSVLRFGDYTAVVELV